MRTRTGAETAPTETGPPGSGRHRAEEPRSLRQGLLYCLAVFISMRVILSLLALVSIALLTNAGALSEGARNAAGIPGPVSVPGWPAHALTPGWHNLWTAWEREDALWFLRIATGG